MSIYGRRGKWVRVVYLMVSLGWYCLTLGGRLRTKKTVWLCYHGISDGCKDRFQWQMKKLRQWGCTQTEAGCSNDAQSGHLSNIYITFDDAFANLLANAVPLLERHRIPAVIFAVAANAGDTPGWAIPENHPEFNERTMTAEQLIMLNRNPLMTIGSHTVTHPDLTAVSSEQLKTELVESRQQLEAVLACSVDALALPHGAYDQSVLQAAQEAGYKRIYTLEPKSVSSDSKNPVVGRFSMAPDVWKIEFLLTCAGAYAWLAPWRKLLHAVRRR